ncbi:50S ribosomal protein L22 [bacterium]|nr:50S ribosomal protein L22 [bacterium]
MATSKTTTTKTKPETSPKKVEEVRAVLRHLRMSPRKVRLVADVVRGQSYEKAMANLQYLNKAAASPVARLLQSAASNAKERSQVETSALSIKTIRVNMGPVLKRYKPRAFGRATPIRKGSSHIEVVLSYLAPAKAAAKPKAKSTTKVDKPAKAKTVTMAEAKELTAAQADTAEGEGQSETKSASKGFAKKMFRRKTG